MICDAGDVVVVPFPFSDIAVAKPRPALVLSPEASNVAAGTTVLAMITSGANPREDDTPINDLATAGLKAASVVRLKLFTLDNRLISRSVGQLSPDDRRAASRAIRGLIAI